MSGFFGGRRNSGSGGSDLFFELGNFALEGPDLRVLVFFALIQIAAEFAVFHQQINRQERREHQQDPENNQQLHGLGVSFGCAWVFGFF